VVRDSIRRGRCAADLGTARSGEEIYRSVSGSKGKGTWPLQSLPVQFHQQTRIRYRDS